MLFNNPGPVIYLRLSISRFAMAYSITCRAVAQARTLIISEAAARTCICALQSCIVMQYRHWIGTCVGSAREYLSNII